MGMDFDGKSCRLDRKRCERGKKKGQRHSKSKIKTQNKNSRIRSLKKRRLQDAKLCRLHPAPLTKRDRKWDYFEHDVHFGALVVNIFKDEDFYCETPLAWDINTPIPEKPEPKYLSRLNIPVYIEPLDRNIYDITQFYSIPDFDTQHFFAEDESCFDHNVLMTIAEYVPEFGFRCFQRSQAKMHYGSVSPDCASPSSFHFLGNFRRNRTFVYKWPATKSTCVVCSNQVPQLKARHFRMELMQCRMFITNSNMLFRLDLGGDDTKKLFQCEARDWSSVTAFITEANLVLLIFSSGKQQFRSMGANEYWVIDDDDYSSHFNECWGVYNLQEVYGFDLDVFLELFRQADNFYDMRFKKHCLFTRRRAPLHVILPSYVSY